MQDAHWNLMMEGSKTDTKKISTVSRFFETMLYRYRLDENTCYIDYDQATTLEYKANQEQVLKNCSQFETLNALGYDLVSGSTENHLVLVNLKNKGIDGSRVEKVMELVHNAANKTTVPGCVGGVCHGSWWHIKVQWSIYKGE